MQPLRISQQTEGDGQSRENGQRSSKGCQIDRSKLKPMVVVVVVVVVVACRQSRHTTIGKIAVRQGVKVPSPPDIFDPNCHRGKIQYFGRCQIDRSTLKPIVVACRQSRQIIGKLPSVKGSKCRLLLIYLSLVPPWDNSVL